jgi:hypothetical protein
MTDSQKRPVGRPSLYRETYSHQVIEEMSTGKSLTAFAAEIGVARSTIQEWEAEHPEFSVAVKKGKAKCAAWWEARGRQIAVSGGAGPGAATLAIFGMKNMGSDDWKDKSELSADVGLTINVIERAGNKPAS